MRIPIPLIGPSYTNRELPLSAQVTKNLWPQIDTEARSIISLHAFPGLKDFATLEGIDRGLHVRNNELFSVSGGSLFSVNSAGVGTNRGSIAGTGRCVLADNGAQLIITTGKTAYVHTTSLAIITDTDLIDPFTVAYLNSRFFYDQGNEFAASALTDGSSVDALDYAEAESSPDGILRIFTYNQLVHMFGETSLEPWYFSDSGRPPYDPVQGGIRPYGLASRYAIAQAEDVLYFLDEDRVPQKMTGLHIQPIGNPALGVEWNSYERVNDAIGLTFILDQQVFFVLTFPSANKTWFYHESSDSWNQLSYGVDGARHRMSSYAFVYNKHIVADHTNGQLYELDFDTFQDSGDVIQRQRTTAMIEGKIYDAPGKEIFFERVEFVLQTGEGLNTGQGSSPELMVRFSDDGGRTYSAEVKYSLGAGGDYLTRVILEQQGSSYGRIYELTYSDPTKFTLISAHADVSFGI